MILNSRLVRPVRFQKLLALMAGFSLALAHGCTSATDARPVAPAPAPAQASPAVTPPPAAEKPHDGAAASEAPRRVSPTTEERLRPARKVVAYYFHRTLRCPTCLAIEKQSREAIEAAFAGELEAGVLEWHAVNIEEPGNEHFEQDFALDAQSLVLVETEGGVMRRWTTLKRVWELVDDAPGFEQYVATTVAAFLHG